MKMKDILLLIDANSLVHRAYHALPPFTAPDGRPTGALFGLSSILIKIFREGLLNGEVPKYIAAAFDTPEPTLRQKEYKEYKATRARAAEDLIDQLKEARKLLGIFDIKFFELPGWEADDLIATLGNRLKVEQAVSKVIVLSGDLDLLQMVDNDKITVLTPLKGISNTVAYNEEAVIKRFGILPKFLADYKGFVGDKSDNIPGVPGVGPKSAATLINKYGILENTYKEIDELGLSDIKLQERLTTFKNQAFLSKKLATLDYDAPISVTLKELEVSRKLNTAKIHDYFSDLGFSSLIERVAKL